MKKEYIVELREEEADKLMDEHWVGELVRCKECKQRLECDYWIENGDDWYCADGEAKDKDGQYGECYQRVE